MGRIPTAAMPKVNLAPLVDGIAKGIAGLGAGLGISGGDETDQEAGFLRRAPSPINGQPIFPPVIPLKIPKEWPGGKWGPAPADLYPPEEEDDDRPGQVLVPDPPTGDIPGSTTLNPPLADPGEQTGTPQAEPPFDAPPINKVDVQTEQQLRQRSGEDDECQECERCKIRPDGEFVLKNYGRNWLMRIAMRYQHHVIPWQVHLSDQQQIMEFDITDPNTKTGKRAMDGFAIAPCFLVEAKLGYSKYLTGGFGDIEVEIRPQQRARNAMQRVAAQLSAHSDIAGRYTAYKFSVYDHSVIWVVSNMLMRLYVGQYIEDARIHDRLSVFTIKAPPSIFTDDKTEADIDENEIEEE